MPQSKKGTKKKENGNDLGKVLRVLFYRTIKRKKQLNIEKGNIINKCN